MLYGNSVTAILSKYEQNASLGKLLRIAYYLHFLVCKTNFCQIGINSDKRLHLDLNYLINALHNILASLNFGFLFDSI